MADIKKIAVIGSGVMGSGIAAQIANGGHNVLLLDIIPKGKQKDRNFLGNNALVQLQKSKPAPLMEAKNTKKIPPAPNNPNLASRSVRAACMRCQTMGEMIQARVNDRAIQRFLSNPRKKLK